MANLSNINGKFVVEQTTGYVGVGTTDPNFLIEAAGANSEIALNSTSASIYRLRSTSSDSFIITKNGVGDRLVIAANGDATFSGNVGIKNTSPSDFLSWQQQLVVGNGSADAGITLYHGSGSGNQGAIVFADGNTGTDRYRGSISYNGADEMKFFTSTAERMRIDSSGNVSIGTVTPLYLVGTSDIAQISVNRVGTTGVITNTSRSAAYINLTGANGGSSIEFNTASGNNTQPSEKMRIDSNGILKFSNVIQTRKIQLWGTQDNDYEFYGFGVEGSTLIYSTYTTGDDHVFFAGTSSTTRNELMRIGGDGKVGINNSAPTSKLNVNGNDNGSAEYSVTLGSTTTAGGTANNASSTPVNKTLLTGYSIPYSGQTNSRLTTCGFLEFASTAGWTGSQRTWAITSGYDIGGQDSGAGGNKMAIILGNAQNVSPQIGTNGAIGESGDGDGANSLVACYWDNALNMRLADSGRLYTGGGGSAALPMITPGTDKNTGIWYPTSDTWALSTAGTERMRITSSGQLGVNTTTFAPTITDQIKLGNMGSGAVGEVFDANVVDGAARMILAAGGNTGQVPILSLRHYSAAYGLDIWMYYNNPWNTYFDNRHPSSGFIFRNNCNADGSEDELMRITGGGDVLIGGSSFVANSIKIDQNGLVSNSRSGTGINSHYDFLNDNGVVGTIKTSGTSTLFNTSSDYRLKEDLKDFAGLDMVSKIPVYNFKWKTDDNRSYGVMAHELQEVLPQAVVGEKDAEEMQSVDYSKIVPLLVKSIQELKAEIELLKSK